MGRGPVDDARPGVDLLDHRQRGTLIERRNDAVAVDECIGRRRLRYDDAFAAPVDPLPGVAAHIDRSEHQFVLPKGEIREINPGVVDEFLEIWIGFFTTLRRDDKVALVDKLSIEEDLNVQVRRRGQEKSAQQIDPANSLPDAPLRPLVNAVPGENECLVVTDIQIVTRLREQIGIDAAVELVKFLLRQPASLIKPFETGLLEPKLRACSQPMQFVFWIGPAGPGNQRFLVIVLRVGVVANKLVEAPELQQDFRVLWLQPERLQVASFCLAKVARLFIHVTALEKEQDIKVWRHGVQRPVIEFGGDQILLAIPSVIRKAEQFAL